MYITDIIGPNRLPCYTPLVLFSQDEHSPFTIKIDAFSQLRMMQATYDPYLQYGILSISLLVAEGVQSQRLS